MEHLNKLKKNQLKFDHFTEILTDVIVNGFKIKSPYMCQASFHNF